MTVRFGLLGQIEAFVGDSPLDLGHVRQRGVLAALLADANHAVSTGQLAERVWADQPPHRADRSLASYLSRLRRILDGVVDIDRTAGGYVVRVDPETIDLHQFGALVRQARATGSLELFDEALALWRGDAFAGVQTPWADAMRETSAAERLAAELDRTDLALRLGNHDGVLSEATARAAKHPFDERVAGQLMLTLYRAGRQADALEHYQRTRKRLADEFGADPGAALRDLHQRILTADSGLEASRQSTVPRQLPAPPRWLVGRDRELGLLTEALSARDGTVPITAISGQGGVGKTALALRWAHREVDRFPDGQLYVNLRGFDPSDSPMPPMVAVRRFLGALGVAAAALPGDDESQVALYRSLVTGRRLLVLLDNARDAAHVEPLLPGSGTCTVLVTSRNQLGGLSVRGGQLLGLGMLPDIDASDLLTRHLGVRRAAEEPDAVSSLVRWCAGLPLAVSIVAARAAAQAGFALQVLAKELEAESARLDALDAVDVNLRAVFSWSYRALDPEPAEVFALLGCMPGPDIGLAAAAALTGLGEGRIRGVLRVLTSAHLLQEHVPGRYRMHDLLRLYVNELADDPGAARRVVEHYLHGAYAAARLVRPESPVIDLVETACRPTVFTDCAAALAWFDVEHGCLLAAVDTAVSAGWHDVVWQLAWCLSAFHVRRGLLGDDLAAWQVGARAAGRVGSRVAVTVALMGLGTARARVGDHDGAVACLEQAEASADLGVLADVHRALGWVWGERGEFRRALVLTYRALRAYRASGNLMREADALNSAGWFHALLGHYGLGRSLCERALALCRELGHVRGEAITLDSLGYVAQRVGQADRALRYYGDALRLADAYDEAVIRANLGEAHLALGNVAEARRAWERARELYAAQQRLTSAAEVDERLACLGQL